MLSRMKIVHGLMCAILVVFVLTSVQSMAEEQKPPERVEQKTDFYYTVKKGDTLWDISRHFFDTPWLWPELWSKNKQVTNPHLIYPGNRIRIYQKDGVVMIEQAPPEEPEMQPRKEEAPMQLEPEPEPEPEPVAPAVPEPEPAEKPYYYFSLIDQVGFIKPHRITPLATIFKSKEDKVLISAGDIVYVKQSDQNVEALFPGGLYTIFRQVEEPVRDEADGSFVGYQYVLKGIVEILDILSKDPLIAEGRVVKTFADLRIDDLLMPYKRKSPKITYTTSVKGLNGKILLAENNKTIFAENDVVFINKGTQDGVEPGQTYSIYREEELGPVTKKINIGTILVLRAEETTSTVIITNASKDIRPGAKIRSAQQM